MWTKIDDALIDHRKLFVAGEALGRNGAGLALGLYTYGLVWSNRHLTDGVLPTGVVRTLGHFEKPIAIAEALVEAGLWEETDGGFRIHDFHDYNPSAVDARAHKKYLSEVRAKAGTNGGRARWQRHK